MLAIMLLHACAKTHYSETLSYTSAIKQPSVFNTEQNQPKATLDREIYHTVSKGETLAKIAKHYGYTETEIAASNGISPPYTITPGETIVIPSRNSIILRGRNYEALPVIIPPPPKPEQLDKN